MASTGSRLKARNVLLSARDTMHRWTSSALSCALAYLRTLCTLRGRTVALQLTGSMADRHAGPATLCRAQCSALWPLTEHLELV